MLRRLLVLSTLLSTLAASWTLAAINNLYRCIQVSATVSRTPQAINFSWPNLPETQKYLVYRKQKAWKSWGDPIATLPAGTTSYSDTSVAIGDAYEYMFLGDAKTSANETYASYGFIYAGIDVPMIDKRGKLILIVDQTYAAALDNELSRLQQDLTGDGWTVIRHNVSRTQTVTSIKQLIVADYLADPANVKAVFLFGRIPVPYSGNCANVNHEDNIGAAEADVFYADMDGVWTDTLVNHTGTAFDTRLNNIPGDGKYDQSEIPSDTELQIGRVDLSSMPTFTQGEQALLKQYLDKDHNFRMGSLAVPRAGKIVATTGMGETSYRNFSAFFGASNVTTLSTWWPASATYLWGGAYGSGSHTTNAVVTGTSSYLTDSRIVFTILGGSYQGDWDYPDDLLRAPLCTTTYGLGAIATGPEEYFHTMALGDTVGSAVWLKQNYDATLYHGFSRADNLQNMNQQRNVWINWMGDPALRLNPVLPPSGLTATATDATTASLSWSASSDTNLQGYLVYRAKGFGPFSKLTPSPVSSTTYTDSGVAAGSYTYMVRAVKLESNGSGTYYNPSQGIFQTVNVGSNAPAVAIVSPLNQAGYLSPATIVIRANVSPGYSGSVSFYNGGTLVGASSSAPYSCQLSGVPNGTYTLTAQVSDANGTTTSEPVTISVYGLPSELTAPWLQADVGSTGAAGSGTIASGSFTITGAGAGFAGAADAFHTIYQPLNVNGSIVAKVNSVQSGGYAAVFIRNSLLAGSQGADISVSSGGTVAFTKRLASDGTVSTETDPTVVSLPYWLKVTRSGDTITVYRSSTGSSWTQVGTPAVIPMGQKPEVGLASYSTYGSTCVAGFSNVSVTSPYIPTAINWKTPYAGDTFNAGTSYTLQIQKPESDDSLFKTIAFFDGGTAVGSPGTGRSATWTPSATGWHTISCNVTDYLNVVGTSSFPVFVNPAGSTLPAVDITSAVEGQCFAAPCDVTLTATASAAAGKSISSVGFYVDGSLIGTCTSAPYTVTWSNVQPTAYHVVTARATDSAGVVAQTPITYLYFFPAQPTVKTKISEVKSLPDGTVVSVANPKVVTAASSTFSDGSYYIEEPDRTSALKAVGGSVTLWDAVTLTGTISTDSSGEKILLVSSVDGRASADQVSTLGMANRSVTASGLLVRVWGKVTISSGSSFVISDGSGSVTVDVSGLATPIADLPSVGAYVSITGPEGYAAGGTLAVKPRCAADVRTY